MKAQSTCALVVVALALCGTVAAAPRSNEGGSPIYGVKLPAEYRGWMLISVAHEAGKNDDIRAILGNAIAIEAFQDGVRPFPDGTVIARLAWRYQPSPRNDAVFPSPQSFVAGTPINVQISVKDSKRYTATGGWGYGQFDDGKPNRDLALIQSCSACHAKLDRQADLVFTDYSR